MDKEKFENAMKIVNEYKANVNKSLITNHTCVCCRKNQIKPIGALLDGAIKASEQEKGMWEGGVVEKVCFGYGSVFDTRAVYVAICDDCVEQLVKDGVVKDWKSIKKEEYKYDL